MLRATAFAIALMKKQSESCKIIFQTSLPGWRRKTIVVNNKNLEKMENSEHLKEIVKQKYSEIALQDKETNQSSCCGSGCCSTEVSNIMSDDYQSLEGYNPDADLGLGCGLPTQFARIQPGQTVIDLGSGAGNDVFIARKEVGETGR